MLLNINILGSTTSAKDQCYLFLYFPDT